MNARTFHIVLHGLIVLALATAGISPACAFVSGKTQLIEICAADGSLKTIEVSEDQASTGQPSDHHKADQNTDCAFCFVNSHTNGLALKTAPFPSYNNGYLSIGSGSALPISASFTAFLATGPPNAS